MSEHTVENDATHEAITRWARHRRTVIREGRLAGSPDFLQGYEDALDDLLYLLVKREQTDVTPPAKGDNA